MSTRNGYLIALLFVVLTTVSYATTLTCPNGYSDFYGGTANANGFAQNANQTSAYQGAEVNAGNNVRTVVAGQQANCQSTHLYWQEDDIGMWFSPTPQPAGCSQNSGRIWQCSSTAYENYLCCCQNGWCA